MTHPTELELTALLRGELSAPRCDALAAHLDLCPRCRAVAERLTAVPTELTSTLLVATGSKHSGENAPSTPRISGYSELREIGRGGAGVVYRAYDLAVDRLVAIKVLRSGALASRSERAWFLAEIEAASKLQHPNIVEILGVGGSHSVPYYIMEYAPEGSLAAKLSGAPVDPRAAAQLVQCVARALHTAHLAGIVHRDLKPGNILLADGGAPKVADFGMAKSATPSEFPTPTQAVLGTPSYMAPEHALGASKRAGPATDVYSLGAILYELLTGRPPFRGETPYETLLQVRSFDLVWPRRLRPDVPRALEAVCLKCLEWNPHHRYPSAAALADDLERFLSGDRVLARVPGAARRAARWARINPAAAKASAALALVLVSSIAALSGLWLHAEEQSRTARASAEHAEEQSRIARASAESALRSRAEARKSLVLYSETAKRLFRGPESVTAEERADFVAAVAHAEDVLADRTGNPDEEHKAGFTLLKLADSLFMLDESSAALRACRKSLDALARLAAEHPDRPRFAFDYSQGCAQYSGTLQKAGRVQEAEAYIREAIRAIQAVEGARPGNDACAEALANYRAKLARILIDRGDFSEAKGLLASAVAEGRRLCDVAPENPFRWTYAYHILGEQADLQFLQNRSVDGFVTRARFGLGCVEQGRKSVRKPDWVQIFVTITSTFQATAALDYQGRTREADELAASSLAALDELAHDVPDSLFVRVHLGSRLEQCGRRQWASRPDVAHKYFVRAMRAYEDVSPQFDSGERLGLLLATCPDPKVRDSDRALQVLPANARPEVRGIVLYAHNDFAGARDALKIPRTVTSPGAPLDVRRRAYLALVLQQVGAGEAARAELDSLTREISRSNMAVWGELPDWALAWRSVHKNEPPALWPKLGPDGAAK
ncbi:protein kinase [Gemmata sp. G18]|uniref:Protein kinase n=1 Tax=Gemmata palustris TaxID=2822762 RepID=A0ABS5BM81_9BACT|nr:serine/threonine-protein kinase [Gemmata palustris]MBP3954788.1 protein kinase [Gemmata palustris]